MSAMSPCGEAPDAQTVAVVRCHGADSKYNLGV
jgi:hypothetical protein